MDFATVLSLVKDLVDATSFMVETYAEAMWFVFLPIVFVVFNFIFRIFQSLLMYRGRRRG